MTARIDLYADRFGEEPVTYLSLGEIEMPTDGLASINHGEEVQIWGQNNGNTILENVVISLDGVGSEFVQLARDNAGDPYRWLLPKQSIQGAKELPPGSKFSFWLRGAFSPEDAEGKKPFAINIEALSYEK